MLDIKFLRENAEAVKENIRKKFQNAKLPLVDEAVAIDAQRRAAMQEASDLRALRNQLSKKVGMLMGQAKKDPSKLAEAEEAKARAAITVLYNAIKHYESTYGVMPWQKSFDSDIFETRKCDDLSGSFSLRPGDHRS